jgi:hypothetical protein
MKRYWCIIICLAIWCIVFHAQDVFATPTTLIWTPSTDIQPYGKVHLNADFYFPLKSHDRFKTPLHVQQVYGPTVSLLSDKPEENLLGKIWLPLGQIGAETGFDYKKGFGPALDSHPWYFHRKLAVRENAYFRNMPALAIGIYDVGIKENLTNNNVWYVRAAKTFSASGLSLGRFSAGYFSGNDHLLLNRSGLRDNTGLMLAWERSMPEISDRLWLCVDFQGTQSGYGALNFGFSWIFVPGVSAIFGFDRFNNPNIQNTLTLQLDIDL